MRSIDPPAGMDPEAAAALAIFGCFKQLGGSAVRPLSQVNHSCHMRCLWQNSATGRSLGSDKELRAHSGRLPWDARSNKNGCNMLQFLVPRIQQRYFIRFHQISSFLLVPTCGWMCGFLFQTWVYPLGLVLASSPKLEPSSFRSC